MWSCIDCHACRLCVLAAPAQAAMLQSVPSFLLSFPCSCHSVCAPFHCVLDAEPPFVLCPCIMLQETAAASAHMHTGTRCASTMRCTAPLRHMTTRTRTLSAPTCECWVEPHACKPLCQTALAKPGLIPLLDLTCGCWVPRFWLAPEVLVETDAYKLWGWKQQAVL